MNKSWGCVETWMGWKGLWWGVCVISGEGSVCDSGQGGAASCACCLAENSYMMADCGAHHCFHFWQIWKRRDNDETNQQGAWMPCLGFYSQGLKMLNENTEAVTSHGLTEDSCPSSVSMGLAASPSKSLSARGVLCCPAVLWSAHCRWYSFPFSASRQNSYRWMPYLNCCKYQRTDNSLETSSLEILRVNMKLAASFCL